jgi:hypothetical protein
MQEDSGKNLSNANELAKPLTGEATTEGMEAKAIREGKNPAAVILGRLGGLKGGKARAAKLTKAERSEIARRAARKRWGYEE